MRERHCPRCQTGWRDDAARWCGRCGSPLPQRQRQRARGAGPLGRPLASLALAMAVTGALASVAEDCCHGRPPPRQGVVTIGTAPPARPAGLYVPASKALGGGLLAVVDGRRLVATDAASGVTVFERDLDELGLDVDGEGEQPVVSLRPYDGGLVVASGATTTALARDGAPRWRLTVDGVRGTRIVVADPERIVLVGSHRDGDALLQVVRTTDGGLRFARSIAALIGVEEQTALVREAGHDTGVTAVSLLDGTVRWASLPTSDAGDDG